MADGIVARLKILLGIDSAEVTTGAKKAEREVSKMSKGISGAAKLATKALGAMGAALTVDTIIRVTKQALAFTVAIKEQASIAGVSTRALQEYRYAALQAGLSNEQLTDGFKELTQKIGEAAAGGKSAAATFKDAGITIRDAHGEVRDAADILPELADAYSKLKSPAEQAAFAARIFGADAGPKMKALLEQGKAGMMDYRAAAHELGLVISDVNIKKAEEAERKMKALSTVLSVRIAGVVGENAGAISDLADALLELVNAAGQAMRFRRGFGNIRANEGWWAALTTDFDEIAREADPSTYVNAYYGRNPLKFKGSSSLPSTTKQTNDLWMPSRSGGNLLRTPPKSSAPSAASPWLSSAPSLLQRRNALGGGSFGGSDMSRFAPGTGAADWIKAAKPIADIAISTAEIAASDERALAALAEMASVHAPRLLDTVRAVPKEIDAIRDATQSILDRLFPDEAEVRRYKQELAMLKLANEKQQLSNEELARSVEALWQEYTGFSDAMREAVKIVPTGLGPSMKDALDNADASWNRFKKGLVDGAGATRVQVVQTFGDMAQDVLSSLDRLSSAIRGGGFLDILLGVARLGLKLGGIGAFGKTIQGNIQSSPQIRGLANGGSMILGGRTGIDRNLLSLNGSPLARVSAGEHMTITPANERGGNGGGELVVRLEKDGQMSAYFQGIAGRVIETVSPAIMDGASAVTMTRAARRNSRQLRG